MNLKQRKDFPLIWGSTLNVVGIIEICFFYCGDKTLFYMKHALKLYDLKKYEWSSKKLSFIKLWRGHWFSKLLFGAIQNAANINEIRGHPGTYLL